MAKLTEKQKLFCDEYLIDLNVTQAAIRAGYKAKYADSQAYKLLDNTEIKDYIDKRMKDRQERTEITQDIILEELRRIALAKPTDFFEVEDMGQYKRVNIVPTKDIPEDKIGAIASIKQGANGIEVKLHDRLKALELIGRHLGMFKDKVEITDGNSSVNVNIDDMLNEIKKDNFKK
ncbi:terminase small subunit [Clostridium sp. 2-1]|uniref:terminase small subunit n=2 Tax=Clostridiaceae TaxID=31979 RepID=UPI000CDA5979|nr:terminase small subunit [Clostridium beijerinckii]POO91031.1 terminase small subunit [Clostridium sp. 2-1]MBN7576006.1 terminase small subunit [Clostridium beijerinckii]MBN7581161.1 terminase small subunit [Clostridium beijerinckii]MBN7585727.1 terminase small subunit [Clostridium beijerinckii]MBO0521516.1 terminase small subunit [Clostridium beijerinckii]